MTLKVASVQPLSVGLVLGGVDYLGVATGRCVRLSVGVSGTKHEEWRWRDEIPATDVQVVIVTTSLQATRGFTNVVIRY